MTRYEATCYRGHEADATFKSWNGGPPEWHIGCHKDHRYDPDYLPLMAEYYGLDRGASKLEIAAAMRDAGRSRASIARAPVPTKCQVRHWEHALAENASAMAYLTGVRGLPEALVREYRIGYARTGGGLWDGWQSAPGFTFPVFRNGKVATVRKRFWPDVPGSAKCISLTGHAAQLFPDRRERTALLCEGELDALLARAHGLPAVTTTCGMGLPTRLAERFRGRRVAVAYDVGGEDTAQRNVVKLRDAGAREAWPVALGLPNKGDDLTDWFLTYGRSAGELVQLIRRAREAAAS